ncbi:probable serine/threonine-protein kinase kinX isoform X2 [Drosophila pseudoobscura]|uniref:Probable serine/threonine-protein kinase kinX isoform X2 n=1 Tax=Drosophila pseudoobscura pseudoobscura TaxID=46245 RepID=A0A6I8V7R2_DROPS|nr:probable serine/threonine-protein kinase kinX isoform X2 [Drosophila pseudoobscura]
MANVTVNATSSVEVKEEVAAKALGAVKDAGKGASSSIRKSSRIPVPKASYSFSYSKPRQYKKPSLNKEAPAGNCSKESIGPSPGPPTDDSGIGMDNSMEDSVPSLVGSSSGLAGIGQAEQESLRALQNAVAEMEADLNIFDSDGDSIVNTSDNAASSFTELEKEVGTAVIEKVHQLLPESLTPLKELLVAPVGQMVQENLKELQEEPQNSHNQQVAAMKVKVYGQLQELAIGSSEEQKPKKLQTDTNPVFETENQRYVRENFEKISSILIPTSPKKTMEEQTTKQESHQNEDIEELQEPESTENSVAEQQEKIAVDVHPSITVPVEETSEKQEPKELETETSPVSETEEQRYVRENIEKIASVLLPSTSPKKTMEEQTTKQQSHQIEDGLQTTSKPLEGNIEELQEPQELESTEGPAEELQEKIAVDVHPAISVPVEETSEKQEPKELKTETSPVSETEEQRYVRENIEKIASVLRPPTSPKKTMKEKTTEQQSDRNEDGLQPTSKPLVDNKEDKVPSSMLIPVKKKLQKPQELESTEQPVEELKEEIAEPVKELAIEAVEDQLKTETNPVSETDDERFLRENFERIERILRSTPLTLTMKVQTMEQQSHRNEDGLQTTSKPLEDIEDKVLPSMSVPLKEKLQEPQELESTEEPVEDVLEEPHDQSVEQKQHEEVLQYLPTYNTVENIIEAPQKEHDKSVEDTMPQELPEDIPVEVPSISGTIEEIQEEPQEEQDLTVTLQVAAEEELALASETAEAKQEPLAEEGQSAVTPTNVLSTAEEEMHEAPLEDSQATLVEGTKELEQNQHHDQLQFNANAVEGSPRAELQEKKIDEILPSTSTSRTGLLEEFMQTLDDEKNGVQIKKLVEEIIKLQNEQPDETLPNTIHQEKEIPDIQEEQQDKDEDLLSTTFHEMETGSRSHSPLLGMAGLRALEGYMAHGILRHLMPSDVNPDEVVPVEQEDNTHRSALEIEEAPAGQVANVGDEETNQLFSKTLNRFRQLLNHLRAYTIPMDCIPLALVGTAFLLMIYFRKF